MCPGHFDVLGSRSALRKSREEVLGEQESELNQSKDDTYRMGRLRSRSDRSLPALPGLLRRLHDGIVQEGWPIQAANVEDPPNYRYSHGRAAGLVHGAIAILGYSDRRVRNNKVGAQQFLRSPQIVQPKCFGRGVS